MAWLITIFILFLIAACVALGLKLLNCFDRIGLLETQNSTRIQALNAVLKLAFQGMEELTPMESFLTGVCRHVREHASGCGTAVFIREGSDMVGKDVAGDFPTLRPVGDLARIVANPKHMLNHIRSIRLNIENSADLSRLVTEKIPQNFEGTPPDWIPEGSFKNITRLLVIPLVASSNETDGLLVVAQARQSRALPPDIEVRLTAISQIMAMGVEGMLLRDALLKERRRMQEAELDGMRRIIRGVIHNLGNAATVTAGVQQQLTDALSGSCLPLAALIKDELLPLLPEGEAQELRAGLEEAVGGLAAELGVADRSNNELGKRLDYISAVIQLQQEHLDELGTEDAVSLHRVVTEAIAVLETDQRALVNLLDERPESDTVIVDRSMLIHLLVSLFVDLFQQGAKGLELGCESLSATSCRLTVRIPGFPTEIGSELLAPLHAFSDKYQGELRSSQQPAPQITMVLPQVKG